MATLEQMQQIRTGAGLNTGSYNSPNPSGQKGVTDEEFLKAIDAARTPVSETTSPQTTDLNKAANPFGQATPIKALKEGTDNIGKAYDVFKNLPGIKQAGQFLGSEFGRGVGAVSAGTEAVGQPIVSAITGKKQTPEEYMAGIKSGYSKGKEFGQNVGQEALPGSLIGGAGKVVGGALALSSGVQGVQDIHQGVQNKDWDQFTRGVLALAPALMGGHEVISNPHTIAEPASIGALKEKVFTPLAESAPIQATKEMVGNVKESMATNAENKALEAGIKKGIQPTISGKKGAVGVQQYMEKAKQAVRTIVQNKDNINLVNDSGEKIPLPKTPEQTEEAVHQTKKHIFDQYETQVKASGEQGAKVNFADTVAELDKLASDQVIQAHNPKIAEYAKAKADSLRGLEHTPAQAQDAIEIYNQKLKNFYQSPNPSSATEAPIDAMIANRLRANLDSTVSNIEGPGYQKLKNDYGALKTIETDVKRQAAKQAIKGSKKSISFLDALTAADVISGITHMNPTTIATGMTAKAMMALYKHMTSPSAYLDRMFKAVDKETIRKAKK